MIIKTLLIGLAALIVCSNAMALPREDVLIVVNDNSLDSPLLGEYYARVRGIDPANIVHVHVPDSYFISWSAFRSLRDQLIRFMQLNTLDDPGLAPAVCSDGEPPYYCAAATEQLRTHSKIRYVVTTRGIPTRMVVDGSALNNAGAPTSVDNYLKYWLINYFATDIRLDFTAREIAFGDGRGMRTVRPASDRELIIGRIDGLSLASAQALIDRTLAAERRGLYGRLFGSTRFNRWVDSSTGHLVYPPSGIIGWPYQLGLFGEDRPECVDYLSFSGLLPEGKSPTYCRVQLNEDGNPVGSASYPAPGNADSRQPQAVDALFYQGWLDGQAAVDSFDAVLNWRKDEQCTLTQCRDAADPAACQAASTDVFGELNSDCVGVAEGFLGYNHQSWPVSYLTAWPTGWFQSTDNSTWNHGGHGDVNQLAFPEVRTDTGFDDSYSLWFGNTDQAADPRCFPSSDFSLPPSLPCPDQRRVVLTQRIALPAQDLDSRNPPSYWIAFRYRATDLSSPTTLRVSFFVREAGGAQISYGSRDVAMLAPGTSDWRLARTRFTLDPARHSAASYDGIKFRIETAGVYAGELGIDAVSVQQVGQRGQLAINGSFREGHRQVATGDHAATFLDRLGGVAFWGSVSHHQSIGCAFCTSGLEPLVYFLRGLPLGDAVWFDESNNSGILYGDPLYSPVAVRLTPVNETDTVHGVVDLYGSTVNGRDPAQVSTRYAIDVCPEDDFRVCDRQASWQSTGISGVGGETNMLLGRWDTSELAPGSYTLRLAVTSQDTVTGRSQTLYDYYPVRGDTDGDGVPDDQDNCIDMANGLAIPDDGGNSQRDTDNDGYGNLCDADFNNDGIVGPYDLSKFKTVYYSSTTPPDQDLDGDGFMSEHDLSIFIRSYGKPPGRSCMDLPGGCGTGKPRKIPTPTDVQANDPVVLPSFEPAPDPAPVTDPVPVPTPAPAVNPAPVTDPVPVPTPASVVNPAPVTEVALVTNPAPATDPAPTTEAASATDPALTTEVAIVTNPAPTTDATPVTEVAPVIEPVALADPVPAPVPVMPVSTQCADPGVAPPDATTWVINLLSSTDRADVDTLAARADSLNIATVVEEIEINGTRYWRLQVTGFDSLKSARKNAGLIQKTLGIGDVWIFSQSQPVNSSDTTGGDCSTATTAPIAPEVQASVDTQQAVQGTWVINLISTTELVTVQRLAARATSLDLKTTIAQALVRGVRVWRLQITGFDSQSSANDYANHVKQVLGITEVWIYKA